MNRIKNQPAAKLPEKNSENSVNSVSKTTPLVSALLDWFTINARDLPWRRTRDPYAIWVSEIMLQQTQVKTVIPYWERWMRELPTIESLAHASADKIHKLWEGLGYYTRVRNLQKAAQQIVANRRAEFHDAQTKTEDSKVRASRSSALRNPPLRFPQSFDAVLALPGIGRYTAGAICSIAFNQPTPILDGNVIRVLTRIHGIKTDPREKQTNAHLWQLAEELVCRAKNAKAAKGKETSFTTSLPSSPSRDSNSCSSLNQSLMELGALICTPRSPNCAACPIQKLCVANKENLQDQLPNLGKREAATACRFLAFVVERDGKFLVHQRPAGVVNAHLWEFPNVEVGARLSSAAAHSHSPRASDVHAAPANDPLRLGQPRSDNASTSNFRIISEKPLRVVKHSITRYRITLEAWHAELASSNGAPVSDPARTKGSVKSTPGRRPALQGEWRTVAELHQLAFTSAHKKILACIGAPRAASARRNK